jgi:inorganic triphosphatase YgiF
MEHTGDEDRALKISNFDLLTQYLKGCGKLTEDLLSKAMRNELTALDSELAKEVSHVANILCAVYFFRQEKDLMTMLTKMPLSQRKVMEDSIRLIWKHLNKLNESEIAELAIETIQKSSELAEKIHQA